MEQRAHLPQDGIVAHNGSKSCALTGYRLASGHVSPDASVKRLGAIYASVRRHDDSPVAGVSVQGRCERGCESYWTECVKAEIRGKYKRNCFSHSANRCHRSSNGKTLLYDQSNAEAVWRKLLLDVALSPARLAC